MSSVELEHVTVRRSETTLLDDVSLFVPDGELIGVVGASGAGKTTLLRAVAGLDPVTAGRVLIGGVDVTNAAPGLRDIAMVFQMPAFVPRRDVRGNIAFPLELRHQLAAEIATRVTAESRALHIEALLTRSPRELSAGEAQLVQVARAMVRMPALLLLDEPLARLDAALTQHMRHELRLLQQGYGVTTFLATNDPVEAMSLPDRLVVLDGGRIVQVDVPMQVYEQPTNLVAAACTGPISTVIARVEADGDGFWIVHPSFRHRVWRPSLDRYVGSLVVVGIRPRWARITANGATRATVSEVGLVTGTVSLALAHSSDQVETATSDLTLRRGAEVTLQIDELALFDAVTGDHLP